MELYFFKSKEHKNYYLIYRGIKGENPERWLAKLTHTGEYIDSGYRQLEIEMGFVFKTDAPDNFLDFLVEHLAINHIENPDYDISTFRSWYEFTDIKNTDKWLSDFYDFQKQRYEELQKANGNGMQTALF
jgi:hypothetical protein